MTAPIKNSLRSPTLDVVAITDPARIALYRSSVANQINKARSSVDPPMKCEDLSEYLSDIVIETSVQGASILEVHVVDPGWVLFQRDPRTGVSFIDVDDSGFLWPPVELTFPADIADSMWRLAAVDFSTPVDSQANVVLTFEDKIVSELRDKMGPVLSKPNETRAEFVKRIVTEIPGLKFIPLLPRSVFTPADLTAGEVTPTTSATNRGRNFKKAPGPATPPPNRNPQGSVISIGGIGLSRVANPVIGSGPISGA